MGHQLQPSSLASTPTASDFTSLPDHESATPSSFFGEKPVLHAAISLCDFLISRSQVRKWDVFRSLVADVSNAEGEESASRDVTNTLSIADLDVFSSISGFVTSSSVILYRAGAETASKAVYIPYPCISIHATQRLYRTASDSDGQPRHRYSALPSAESASDLLGTETAAIYLQLDMDPSIREHSNAADDEDEAAEDRVVEILLVPQADSPTQDPASSEASNSSQVTNEAKVKEIFEALSRCADLNPDASIGGDEEGGGLPSMLGFASGGMPGEGGWITSENAHEFEDDFDMDGEEAEDGEGLGPGSGTRRTRDGLPAGSDAAAEHVNGSDHDTSEEAKRQRTV